MKIFINTLTFLVFIAQFIFFVLSALNQKKPDNATESLYNYVVFGSILCSLITIAIFAIQYNFKCKFLTKKLVNCILLMIVVPGIYIHITQLFALNDFILISCVLLFFDYYIIHKILSNLIKL